MLSSFGEPRKSRQDTADHLWLVHLDFRLCISYQPHPLTDSLIPLLTPVAHMKHDKPTHRLNPWDTHTNTEPEEYTKIPPMPLAHLHPLPTHNLEPITQYHICVMPPLSRYKRLFNFLQFRPQDDKRHHCCGLFGLCQNLRAQGKLWEELLALLSLWMIQ